MKKKKLNALSLNKQTVCKLNSAKVKGGSTIHCTIAAITRLVCPVVSQALDCTETAGCTDPNTQGCSMACTEGCAGTMTCLQHSCDCNL